jgi:hypothetical protein
VTFDLLRRQRRELVAEAPAQSAAAIDVGDAMLMSSLGRVAAAPTGRTAKATTASNDWRAF